MPHQGMPAASARNFLIFVKMRFCAFSFTDLHIMLDPLRNDSPRTQAVRSANPINEYARVLREHQNEMLYLSRRAQQRMEGFAVETGLLTELQNLVLDIRGKTMKMINSEYMEPWPLPWPFGTWTFKTLPPGSLANAVLDYLRLGNPSPTLLKAAMANPPVTSRFDLKLENVYALRYPQLFEEFGLSLRYDTLKENDLLDKLVDAIKNRKDSTTNLLSKQKSVLDDSTKSTGDHISKINEHLKAFIEFIKSIFRS